MLPNGLLSVGNHVFSSCPLLKQLVIPSSVISIGSSVIEGCNSLTRVVVEQGNEVYDSRDNCNAIIHSATNTLIAGCNVTTIPSSITSIGNQAFYDCDGLLSIEIPSGVTSIGDDAFRNCDLLTTVTIPDGVKTIGNYAFYLCGKLLKVTSWIQNPFTINNNVFSSIHKNAVLYVPADTKEAYESIGGWNKFSKILEMPTPPIFEIIEFFDFPLKTFCSSNALNFSTVDGVEAYIASGFNAATGNVIMTKVERVPSHTGVLLLGKMGQTYEIPIAQFECDYSNLLVGVVTDTPITQGYTLDSDGCFSPINGTQTIKAKEAYLNLPQNNASQVKICFEDGIATDIDTIEKTTDSPSDTWFTLQGNRLNKKPIKQGIYLHGGRKVFVK